MPKLPVVKPRDVVSFLKKNGFYLARSDGSHQRYHHADGRKVTIAFHNKPLKKGTLKAILRQAGLTTDQLVEYL
ncbi:MAG TPA: type II toxin-antitoxin system HicA family toxin [Candidatus Wunengus sp. YC60]|uniref:type II toxin-antitoxin system HicA family toxin n=1 Tax=Candidatus Wunengus sp. YC60 TaxID=3367697 RepID=UPI004024F4FF